MLGPKREQFLFEIQIERYGTSQIERDGGRICCRQILPGASDRQQLGMQLNGPRSIFLRRAARFVFDHYDFALQK